MANFKQISSKQVVVSYFDGKDYTLNFIEPSDERFTVARAEQAQSLAFSIRLGIDSKFFAEKLMEINNDLKKATADNMMAVFADVHLKQNNIIEGLQINSQLPILALDLACCYWSFDDEDLSVYDKKTNEFKKQIMSCCEQASSFFLSQANRLTASITSISNESLLNFMQETAAALNLLKPPHLQQLEKQ